MDRYFTKAGAELVLETRPLAAPGGEGAVYRINSGYVRTDCCAKIYHPQKRTGARQLKVAFMISNQPTALRSSSYIICWPLELIFDARGSFLGFVMPLAFADSEKLYELTTLRIRPGLHQDWQKFDRRSIESEQKRLKMSVNIAIAVNAIHATGKYTMVDYKPQNLLITTSGKVSLTDVDSMQIADAGRVLHHAEVMTAEYAPPESSAITPGSTYVPDSWDRFSLAVSFYELLFGIHPYVATAGGTYAQANEIGQKIQAGLFVHGARKGELIMIPHPHNGFAGLPANIRNLFMQAFEGGLQKPSLRPTAQLWGQTIARELEYYQPRTVPAPLLKASVTQISSSTAQQPAARHAAGIPAVNQPLRPTITTGSSQNNTWIFVGLILFFGCLITCSVLNRQGSTPPPVAAADTGAQTILTAAPQPLQRKHRTVKSDTSGAAPVLPACATRSGIIQVSNSSDQSATLYLSIYSAKKKSWGSWKSFKDIQPHTSGSPLTNEEGTKILKAQRYRWYAVYSDGTTRYSQDDAQTVNQCDENFTAVL